MSNTLWQRKIDRVILSESGDDGSRDYKEETIEEWRIDIQRKLHEW